METILWKCNCEGFCKQFLIFVANNIVGFEGKLELSLFVSLKNGVYLYVTEDIDMPMLIIHSTNFDF